MKVETTALPEVLILTPQLFGDERGFFMESYNQQTFNEIGVDATFVQDNHSRSKQGILRGLHYQIEQPQGKLVRVTQGEVYDVAVDIRRNSPNFGRWVGVHLSASNHQMLWVPPGFAHGFYVISDSADFLYKCTELYAPEHERCIQWDDAEIGIQWPLIEGQPPQLSAKDQQGSPLSKAEVFP